MLCKNYGDDNMAECDPLYDPSEIREYAQKLIKDIKREVNEILSKSGISEGCRKYVLNSLDNLEILSDEEYMSEKIVRYSEDIEMFKNLQNRILERAQNDPEFWIDAWDMYKYRNEYDIIAMFCEKSQNDKKFKNEVIKEYGSLEKIKILKEKLKEAYNDAKISLFKRINAEDAEELLSSSRSLLIEKGIDACLFSFMCEYFYPKVVPSDTIILDEIFYNSCVVEQNKEKLLSFLNSGLINKISETINELIEEIDKKDFECGMYQPFKFRIIISMHDCEGDYGKLDRVVTHETAHAVLDLVRYYYLSITSDTQDERNSKVAEWLIDPRYSTIKEFFAIFLENRIVGDSTIDKEYINDTEKINKLINFYKSPNISEEHKFIGDFIASGDPYLFATFLYEELKKRNKLYDVLNYVMTSPQNPTLGDIICKYF